MDIMPPAPREGNPAPHPLALAFRDHPITFVPFEGTLLAVGPQVEAALDYAPKRLSKQLARWGEKGLVREGVHFDMFTNGKLAAFKAVSGDWFTKSEPVGPRAPNLLVITERGLYRLLTLIADKAIAIAFQDWLETEVLPAINRTGRYDVREAAAPAPVSTSPRAPAGSVGAWVGDACTVGGGTTSFRALYSAYLRWSRQHGFITCSSQFFAQELGRLGHPASSKSAVEREGIVLGKEEVPPLLRLLPGGKEFVDKMLLRDVPLPAAEQAEVKPPPATKAAPPGSAAVPAPAATETWHSEESRVAGTVTVAVLGLPLEGQMLLYGDIRAGRYSKAD
ncbi:MAG TPA: hypothetical protein VEA41_22450 [Salinarimonas sp.]|nr:hypothetical protein [Salinarimonas sp.]